VGGGLAGLCLAIQLSKLNHSVLVIEKNEYPFHKVCGEYISNESWNFLESLGLPLKSMDIAHINLLGISSTYGTMVESPLKMGGFGISRYTLDSSLSNIAVNNGVVLMQNCKANSLILINGIYYIETSSGTFNSKIVCGSFGKHNPLFNDKVINDKVPSYIGVKYHIKTNFPSNKIELHNFKNGYCGISKVDGDKLCLCYLTTAENLNINNNNIQQMEKNVLYKNPFLKRIFENSEFLYDRPLTVSNVTFKSKSAYKNDIFLLGDAAGTIAPLCGNGMSMGMRASYLLASILNELFNKKISKAEAISLYNDQWRENFSIRIKAGYYLQQILNRNSLTHFTIKLLDKSPKLFQKIITLTHGTKF
jgi:flavin-dependent dehydrogenase